MNARAFNVGPYVLLVRPAHSVPRGEPFRIGARAYWCRARLGRWLMLGTRIKPF